MDKFVKSVKKDCEEVLHRFMRTESVRFEVFSSIWREMKFSEIFYGTLMHEKRKFSRLILDTAYSFFLPPFSFQIRVGGLYLLYSLYRCQTADPPESIRLSLKDWNDVKKFEKDAVDAKHLDVVYIFQKLMFLKAFQFTAMPILLTFDKKKKRGAEESVSYEEFMERPSRPQELINMELLEEMSNIHGLYEKLKTSASLTSGASSVDLTQKDLVSKLQRTVVNFYSWQQRMVRTVKEEDSGEGMSSQQECYDRAERLALIKSKAFGQAAEAAKSRRHRQVELNLASNDAGPSSSHSRPCKPSLKVRTNKNIHLSGDMWKEVASRTRISHLTTVDFGSEEKQKKKSVKFSLN